MCDGAGCERLEVEGARLEKVADVAGSIHINSPVLFFVFFIFHFSYFLFYIFTFKNTSGMDSVGSLRKMFGRTAGCIKRAMGEIN
jgi:hypothetical protein